MKKLMVAAAVALAAVALNAANINWNVTNAIDPTIPGYANGWAVYVFADSATDIGSQNIYTREALIAALGNGSYDFSKAISEKGVTSNGAANGIATGFGAGTDANPNNVGIYAVLVNSDDISTATKAYVAEVSMAPIGTAGEASPGLDLMGSYTGTWTNVAAVPEPTSGLLLLLGVAGLALKRKRA